MQLFMTTLLNSHTLSPTGVDMYRDEKSDMSERLQKLATMQYQLLSHALSVPNVKTVVYSTCSVHREENEDVVQKIMLNYSHAFTLEDLSLTVTEWKSFGLSDCEFSKKVLRTDPDVDKCHGFFVAKFIARQRCIDFEKTQVYK